MIDEVLARADALVRIPQDVVNVLFEIHKTLVMVKDELELLNQRLEKSKLLRF